MAVFKKSALERGISLKKRLAMLLSVCAALLLAPAVLLMTDPMFLVAKYKFRLENGSILHELLQQEIEGGRFAVYLFNITNADRFLAGRDHKLKLDEIGPFTYVEYRLHDKLQLDSAAHRMWYTPRMRSVFIPEESIAYPEHVRLMMPNIPMLSATSMIRSSPHFVQSAYSLVARQYNSRPVVAVDAASYLWGYRDPVLSLANSLAPGFIHFNSTGVMDRKLGTMTALYLMISLVQSKQ